MKELRDKRRRQHRTRRRTPSSSQCVLFPEATSTRLCIYDESINELIQQPLTSSCSAPPDHTRDRREDHRVISRKQSNMLRPHRDLTATSTRTQSFVQVASLREMSGVSLQGSTNMCDRLLHNLLVPCSREDRSSCSTSSSTWCK